MKSRLNKTIDFSAEDGKEYISRCISGIEDIQSFSAEDILDKTINADSFTALKKFPPECADLIIADPPYNLDKTYDSTKFKKKDSGSYSDYTRTWISLTVPLLKDNGSLYICCDWKTSILIADILSEFEQHGKLFIRNRITWQREKGRGAKSNWKNCHEDIWFVTKGTEYKFNLNAVKIRRKVIAPYRTDGKPKDWTENADGNYRDTCPSNFWDDITIPFWSMPENTAHPTQKPEKLAAKLILASSNPGDLVIDPFCGSGTICVTAKKLNRHWCGIEKEEKYCAWTEYRLEKASSDSTIQGLENGVFLERNFSASR